jgi:hypothetical protein
VHAPAERVRADPDRGVLVPTRLGADERVATAEAVEVDCMNVA